MSTDYTQDANCVGAWLFTEGSGTTVDDASVNSNTGNFKGAGEPAWDTTDVPFAISGSAPNSVDFDGTDDYMYATASASINNLSNFTFVALVYKEGGGGANLARIFDKAPRYFYDDEDNIPDAGSNGLILEITTDGTSRFAVANTTIPTGSWTHVACTYASGNAPKIYFNGVEDSYYSSNAGSGTDSSDSGTNLQFGGRASGGRTFNGKMTEIAIFDRVLSQAEIQDIYNYGLTGTPNITVSTSPISLSASVVSSDKKIDKIPSPIDLSAYITTQDKKITKIPSVLEAAFVLTDATVSIVAGDVTIVVDALSFTTLVTSVTPLVIKIPSEIAATLVLPNQVPKVIGIAQASTTTMSAELASPAWGVQPIALTFSIPEVTILIPDITIKVAALSLNALLNSTTPLVIKIPSEIAVGLVLPSQGARVSKETTVIEAAFTQPAADKAINKIAAPIELSLLQPSPTFLSLFLASSLSLSLSQELTDVSIIKEVGALESILALQDATVSFLAPPLTIYLSPLIMTFTLPGLGLGGVIEDYKWYSSKHYQDRFASKGTQTRAHTESQQTKATAKHRFR